MIVMMTMMKLMMMHLKFWKGASRADTPLNFFRALGLPPLCYVKINISMFIRIIVFLSLLCNDSYNDYLLRHRVPLQASYLELVGKVGIFQIWGFPEIGLPSVLIHLP